MLLACIIINILAIALPSLRIFSLLLIRIATIALLYVAALSFNVVYIQSIGSDIGIFSVLFTSSLVPVKPKRLTNLEKSQFTLTDELKEILVGLILGDLYLNKQPSNVRLMFKQGIVNKDYLMHLYEIFSGYCSSGPKFTNAAPDARTGIVYTGIYFNTYSLPCFVPLYNLFYPNGKKIIPFNIGELLTELSLAYWLCDDGTFVKGRDIVILCTESFSESEVDLLLAVLQNKFGLKCRKDKRGNGFRIYIVKSSLNKLRELVHAHLPSSMLYKIGL
jgi:hypothetical protein